MDVLSGCILCGVTHTSEHSKKCMLADKGEQSYPVSYRICFKEAVVTHLPANVIQLSIKSKLGEEAF